MIEPQPIGLRFGSEARKPRRRETDSSLTPAPAFVTLNGPTLLDAAGDVLLWAEFTGRDTGEHMHAKELTELATAVERRAGRAVENARRNVEHVLPASGNRAGAWAELSRKLISDELRSEWLRMHCGRRPKRAELAQLARLFGQLDAAVQAAIEHVEPDRMPATARAAINALAAPVSAGR